MQNRAAKVIQYIRLFFIACKKVSLNLSMHPAKECFNTEFLTRAFTDTMERMDQNELVEQMLLHKKVVVVVEHLHFLPEILVFLKQKLNYKDEFVETKQIDHIFNILTFRI